MLRTRSYPWRERKNLESGRRRERLRQQVSKGWKVVEGGGAVKGRDGRGREIETAWSFGRKVGLRSF